MDEEKIFDVFILDVYIGEEMGTDLAKNIRKRGIESPIVFLTTSVEHAPQGYETGTLRYLIKPLDSKKLYEAMEAAIQQAEKILERLIRVKTENGIESINANHIMYSEAHDHYQYITMNDGGTLKVRATVSELFTTLAKNGGFVRLGSSYIINLRNIKNLSSSEVLVAQIEAENAQRAADSHARHDRRHHNLMMLEYANNGDLESVKEYLSGLVESDNEVRDEVRYCENMTMNTVLTVYERRAKENGICVTISADGSRDLSVLPRDLVIVIANLFENAINATAKLKKIDKRIDILIKESAQRLVVKVENPCKANLSFDESNFGVGIRSVIATATKYEGMYDFTAEDGIFSAKIILNLK